MAKMRILALWYSRTETTTALVHHAMEELTAMGHVVRGHRLTVRLNLPYPAWLALSFFPNLSVKLAGEIPDPGEYDGLLLGFPKWTFGCPVINGFLARNGHRLPPTSLLVSCGGWDEDRYLMSYIRKIRDAGAEPLGGYAITKKKLAAELNSGKLAEFLAGCFPPGGGD